MSWSEKNQSDWLAVFMVQWAKHHFRVISFHTHKIWTPCVLKAQSSLLLFNVNCSYICPKKWALRKHFDRWSNESIEWKFDHSFVCVYVCEFVSLCNFCSVWNVEFRFQYFLFLSLSISLAPFRCVITSTRAPFLVYFCFTYLIYCCRFLSRRIMIQRARVNFVMFIQCFEVIYCLF